MSKKSVSKNSSNENNNSSSNKQSTNSSKSESIPVYELTPGDEGVSWRVDTANFSESSANKKSNNKSD